MQIESFVLLLIIDELILKEKRHKHQFSSGTCGFKCDHTTEAITNMNIMFFLNLHE